MNSPNYPAVWPHIKQEFSINKTVIAEAACMHLHMHGNDLLVYFDHNEECWEFDTILYKVFY